MPRLAPKTKCPAGLDRAIQLSGMVGSIVCHPRSISDHRVVGGSPRPLRTDLGGSAAYKRGPYGTGALVRRQLNGPGEWTRFSSRVGDCLADCSDADVDPELADSSASSLPAVARCSCPASHQHCPRTESIPAPYAAQLSVAWPRLARGPPSPVLLTPKRELLDNPKTQTESGCRIRAGRRMSAPPAVRARLNGSVASDRKSWGRPAERP
jgi:hypothetical protein